jgi:predicted AAA+ superfamily ATPase
LYIFVLFKSDIMERLYNLSRSKAENTSLDFKRYLFSSIDFSNRMIGIKGARGTGKTTLLLQRLKELPADVSLYFSLDDIYFSNNQLVSAAEEFVRKGGKYLLIDEVHKYPNWSQELKNIYDNLPELTIIFTSSSALEINKGKFDLSRRAVIYVLQGLSFREYLNFKYGTDFQAVTLDEILINQFEIYSKISSSLKPLQYFEAYLQKGYYPYFIENEQSYWIRLNETINQVIENDLPAITNIDFTSIMKIKKLVFILASMVPYTPNINQLAVQLNSTRDTVLRYLQLLHTAHILKWLTQDSWGINFLNKPDKLYLENTNLAFALQNERVNIGSLRETFFLNQISLNHQVSLPKQGDFFVDSQYTFEVGGKSKTTKQIVGIEKAFIVSDELDFGFQNKIPLWIFGFLY